MPRLSVKTPSRRLSVSCADAFPKTRSEFAVSRRREHPPKSRRAFREKHRQKTRALMRVNQQSVSGVRITTEAARVAPLSRTLFCVLVFFCMHGQMARARRREGTRFLVERASLSFFFPTVKRRRLRSL
jgi:hypothetical protein